ncbi:N-acetylmuramoyl-L-alanine amidase [Bacteroides caccae]|uniref:N-acetylmuramoyl-L-alanine amidase n=1 Tax=Bacteroides caccae TaxID=47678 RepID=UPI00196049A4
MAKAAFLVLPALFAACSDTSRPPAISFRISNAPPVPRTMSQMAGEVRIERDFMSPRSRARRAARSMKPRFITIHSTANPKGDANAHSRYLNSGKSRSLNWHFTVDQFGAYQHIPTTETGHHADHSGPGDKYSVAIEMCECTTHNPAIIYNKTAKLTALLMQRYGVPLRNVVPHNYWSGKNCPAPLMTNGRPGYKWSWFISRVDYYYRCLQAGK